MNKKKEINFGELNKGIFLVNTLGIVFNTNNRKILIGLREDDDYVPKLTWSFPGGVPEYGRDLELELEKIIKEKTGFEVKNLGAVFSRCPKENEKFLLIYYLCEVINGKEKAGGGFKKLKWVNPEELENYFTTSFDKRLKEYILNLK